MDLTALRDLFPVTRHLVYLDNAAESPLNTRVRDRLTAYLASTECAPQRKPPLRREMKALLAQLLGGHPEDYALVTSTGVGLNLAARGYPWRSGDNVVLPAEEHWNNAFPWLALQDLGVEVRRVPLDAHRVDPSQVAACMDGRTRVLAVAAVRHLTGFRSDLAALGALARERGALFVVDGIQAAGVVPLDVEALGIDVLACGGFKWLLGPAGTGFLYVRPGVQRMLAPVLPGMYAAEDDLEALRYLGDARRYETGTVANALFHAWAAGIELLLELGVPSIHARVLDLTDRLLAGLASRGLDIVSPVARREERSAILAFSAGSPEANRALVERLAARGIAISLRGGRCRVSPACYTTEAEIDQFLAALG